MEHTEKDFSIRHSSKLGKVCPIRREHINGAVDGWHIAISAGLVSNEALDSVPAADLRTILADVKSAKPALSEIDGAIVNLSVSQAKNCFVRWQNDLPIYRENGVVWGLAVFSSGMAKLLAPQTGWERYPTLATVLHRHGQFPPRPVPPAPPPPAPIPPPEPTAEEQRAALVAEAAELLQVEPDRAEKLLGVFASWWRLT